MTDAAWDRAALALRLLALDPYGLGGAVLRMRAGGPRDAVLSALHAQGITDRLPIAIPDGQLMGGLDVHGTLAARKPVYIQPFFAAPRAAIMPMAERCPPGLAARLAQILDGPAQSCLLCLDEGAQPDEAVPAALTDRLAFHIAPDGRVPGGWSADMPSDLPPSATVSAAQMETLVRLAVSLGIDSLRAPLLAVRAAKAHARLHERVAATRDDIEAAAALVFAHRATCLPDADTEDQPETAPEPAEAPDNAGQSDTQGQDIPDEMLVEAVRAMLPNGVLDLAKARAAHSAKGSGAGARQKSSRRGRPLPPRPGRADGRQRIDILATLRAAAPWQRLRDAAPGQLRIRPSDIRLKRFAEQSERLLIFTVDASGSAAVARLGEAKGAVELLLAEAYSNRDHVALVTFGGAHAELRLPPTRSLVQTKRRLAALPGGGATPLAAGLNEASKLAENARSKGMTPTLVLLTDGRANIALDGTANRTSAQSDAQALAKDLWVRGVPGLVIDTGMRPSDALRGLSEAMGSPYIALPRADAARLQSAVSTALRA